MKFSIFTAKLPFTQFRGDNTHVSKYVQMLQCAGLKTSRGTLLREVCEVHYGRLNYTDSRRASCNITFPIAGWWEIAVLPRT